MTFVNNPIARGFYPDPSVCRVGKRYYRVHSTFAYAPGIPIFESEDLVTWKQIGHVLERPEQLQLDRSAVSGGIYAPTIRWHDGLFYVIVTNVDLEKDGSGWGNFYVTAADPAGPWSDPVIIEGADGIDPSLYFEGDRAWYIGQHHKEDAAYFGDCEIWLQELDLTEGKLIGERHLLWDGAMKKAVWPEGPHLYHKDGYYYLMIAESGTEFAHSISIARSRKIEGPYESCPCNPIFTHRHLGRAYPVQCAGHGDLVDTPEGSWYVFMLAVRKDSSEDPMGRETFIADVVWEDGWPVINAGEGKLRELQWIEGTEEVEQRDAPQAQSCMEVHAGSQTETQAEIREGTQAETQMDFQSSRISWQLPLDPCIIGLRRNLLTSPDAKGRKLCRVSAEKGLLTMQLMNTFISETDTPEMLCIRQQEKEFRLACNVESTEIMKNGEAGILLFYDENNFLSIYIGRNREGRAEIRTEKRVKGESRSMPAVPVEDGCHLLEIVRRGSDIRVSGDRRQIALWADTTEICSGRAGGFTGCVLGIYGRSIDGQYAGNASFGPMEITYL